MHVAYHDLGSLFIRKCIQHAWPRNSHYLCYNIEDIALAEEDPVQLDRFTPVTNLIPDKKFAGDDH